MPQTCKTGLLGSLAVVAMLACGARADALADAKAIIVGSGAGGSICLPAPLCVAGLKPTQGWVSRVDVATRFYGGEVDPEVSAAFAQLIGFSATGLPLSMQLVGRPFGERRLLEIGTTYEATMRTSRRLPELPGAQATPTTPERSLS